ncbi:uncharacterized mitochondrial protein AtMg00860-like [Gigantopelta aegis]|uniref:uncharacterized mitochondrial protein AtMg00860-like n=1 Tax=Gigantopelta aegis TaxID=1735272 RepID=UPI001B88D746|nr:uncharacterized mitochondrial protein AtMg00860-like [Gigantopelta aegis]
MDTILHDVPGVICYIHDILVTGKTKEDHLRNLKEVFQRLEKHGFRVKREKCIFLQESVEYLAHQIDQTGIQAVPSKIDAIVNAPEPTNVQELRSFLGLLNYNGKFIQNLSSILHPLNRLLQVKQKWDWTEEYSQAFKRAKDQLTSSEVLIHYDPKLPINLATDASAYGIGAVMYCLMAQRGQFLLLHTPLTASEKNYAQLLLGAMCGGIAWTKILKT